MSEKIQEDSQIVVDIQDIIKIIRANPDIERAFQVRLEDGSIYEIHVIPKKESETELVEDQKGKKKETVWDKLIRYASPSELSGGKTDIGKNYKKYLYGKGGIIK